MTAPRISVLCPTRNRPGNVARLTESGLDTAGGPVEFVFYCDADAPGSVPEDVAPCPAVSFITGPRIVLSDMWNKCYALSSAPVVMQCGDDIEFRTPGWDTEVLAAFDACPDRILLAYGDDLIHGEALASHGFVHRRWADTVGYLTPPWFSSDYGDAWLHEVAGMLDRRKFLPGVVTEHHHPTAGKAEWDLNHQERLARHHNDHVDELFASLAPEREKDAAKLRAVMS